MTAAFWTRSRISSPEYQRLRFTLPEDLEDQFVAALWSLGALGFEVAEAAPGSLRVDAWFPAPLAPAADGSELARWTRRGVRAVGSEGLADRDWLASYRAAAEPFDVGRRFRIDSGEASAEEAAGDGRRRTLKIPAQTAFGTGSHESTRLVLEWLEELDLTGLEVLDVGTGSGILSFAAEHLGAERVVGFDVDAQSICIARGNARFNQFAPRLFAGSLTALRLERRFDLALVNILPENFSEISRLTGMLKPGSRVISSGNLAERRGELLARWQRWGFVLRDERRQAEWIAFLLVTSTS